MPCLPPAHRLSSSPEVSVLYSICIAPPSPRRGVRHYHTAYEGADLVARAMGGEGLLAGLANAMDQLVALHARRRVFVHAGAVEWKRRAILLPGKSHSGKTTLVAALIEAGASLLSDEYAVLDPRGLVHPYPRPLGIRPEAGTSPVRCLRKQTKGRPSNGPVPIGLIVATKHRPSARWSPRTISSGQAVLELLAHTIPARSRPAETLAALVEGATSAIALKGDRGEAEAVSADLLDRL